MYRRFFKRLIDIILSLTAIIVLSPILIILMVVGAIKMGGNPFFCQKRPGKIDKNTGKEKIFSLIKFRTMDNRKDEKGNLLPDSVRLNSYGKWLRSTSLDELPSLFCILNGDISIVGPRPFLVRDMVFMSENVRKRHLVSPGLTGLAQVNGRNNITWEEKFEYDLDYIKNISFIEDVKIIFATALKVIKKSDVVREGTDSDIDYGDWLLMKKEVTQEYYDEKQEEAKKILGRG